MATITLAVSVYSHRNTQRYPAIRRPVTGNATIGWSRRAGHMLRMIKLDIKTFFERGREIPEGWLSAGRVGMANLAHRDRRAYPLTHMAALARRMAGKARRD
ncbi:MAG TPA: hypothetical protein VK208_04830 [Pyrinomonadaceae bacterium]|nr:hypothetical protein [Pyrinomonadaceae bacterium]